MLGLREDAEDVLQDAWLRFADVDLGSVGNSRAYLVTIVTRLSMDVFKSARRRREEYVGTWLPEPVSSDVALPDDLAEQADSVSFAFLILLERLTPTQRAVLVLHDVLDYSHDEALLPRCWTAFAAGASSHHRIERATGTSDRRGRRNHERIRLRRLRRRADRHLCRPQS